MLLEGSLCLLSWLYASYVLNIYFPCERNKSKIFSSKGPTTSNFSYIIYDLEFYDSINLDSYPQM